MMLKFFNIALIPCALILITAKVALTQQSSKNYQYPLIPDSSVNTPVCYMYRENGTVQDLTSICGKTSEQPPEQLSITNNSQEADEQLVVMNPNGSSPDVSNLKKQICESEGYCPTILEIDVANME